MKRTALITLLAFIALLATASQVMGGGAAVARQEMPPQIAAACEAEGGCVFVSRARIKELVDQAASAGLEQCRTKNGSFT